MTTFLFRATLFALLALGPLLVPGAARASEGGIVALSPQPNEHVPQSPKAILIQVSGRSSLDKSAVKVAVDGRDVSSSALLITGNLVQYKPGDSLQGGDHTVEVTVTDAAGGHLSYSWTFTIDDLNIISKQHNPGPTPP